LLQTLQALPPQGTLQESVIILLLMKIENIEHARFRALAQLIIDKDSGVKAFEEYMKIAFPYMEASKREERNKHIELLKREMGFFKHGIGVRALPQPKVRSRVKTQVSRRQEPRSTKDMDALYSRMGAMMDPYGKRKAHRPTY